MDPERKNRLLLLLTGLAAGDSLGATSEFCGPAGVAKAYEKHGPAGWPFRQAGGGPFGWDPGDPTDDTDMALCLVRSYLARGRFDSADVAGGFVRWLAGGPRDVGGTTAAALGRVRDGVPWHDGGYEGYLSDPGNAANGSLMRNGVVAALADDLDTVFRYTVQQAIVTHYDPLSVLCCCAQSFLLHRLLHEAPGRGGPADGWADAFADAAGGWLAGEADPAVRLWHGRVGADRVAGAMGVLRAADFSAGFDPFDPRWQGVGQGYAVLTLQVGVWALRWALAGAAYPRVPAHLPAAPFRRTGADVLGWVALVGRDADSYGATAGPLVAAALGGLPPPLTAGLRAVAEVTRLLDSPDPTGT